MAAIALAKPASEVRIGEAIRALDGPLAPILCASLTAYQSCGDCCDPVTCRVRISTIEMRDAISDILDIMTLAQFARTETGRDGFALSAPA